jgi:ABC-type multidrug transport system ATPase subunit
MSRPLPPTITVSFGGGWQRTFAQGRDVVVGRDVRADVRLPHPAVSRVHVLLRYHDGRWVAIDNESRNGIFLSEQRVYSVDIRSGQILHIGDPEGPWLTFELGPPRRDDPPATRMRREADRGTDILDTATTVLPAQQAASGNEPSTTRIGRVFGNDVVIPDVLASGHHATLVTTPEGVRIQDAGSANGTFVNGQRVNNSALKPHDIVTIGNVDFVFENGNLVRRIELADKTGGLDVCDISLTIEGNRALLDRVSFSAKPATLTAVIGPSGSGKTSLLKVMAGGTRPDSGAVLFEGHDVHAEYASMRTRIGMVPQDDVVHRQLTINQALGYAAELRMPPDTTKEDRHRVVAQVLEELELTPHADARIEKLSGGQRKRASVALELLTGPSLLVLDEPTTGLDPALDQQVMKLLRQLADAGRVIVVVTHSLAYLDVCDQVLLLAPGGKAAFSGPPSELAPAMGTADWADIFTDISADPDAAQRRFLERAGRVDEPPIQPALGQPAASGKQTNLWRQFWTLVRRQLRLLVADRGYFVFLALLPFIVGLLPLAVAGDAGFGKAAFDGVAPNEAKQILVMMNFGAFFMGTALTVRTLVGERAVFRREQAVGLSTSAYLAAKIAVFATIAIIQSAVLVLVVTIGKGAPMGATVLGSPTFELFVGIAATCVASAIVGLFVSALAQNSNQVLPLTVVALMVQVVLAGGMIPVTDRVLDPVSWLTPARWGLAATASTADLTNTVLVISKDSHWSHTASAWLFDIGMLGVLSVFYACLVRWKLRLRGAISAR